MMRRGDSSPRYGSQEKPAHSPFHDSFCHVPMHAFDDPYTYPNRKVPKMNKTANAALNTATIDMNDPTAVAAEAERTRKLADTMSARLEELRGQNDAAAAAPTGAVSKALGNSFVRTSKRILGWTLGVGVVGVIGAYAYSRLRAAGVDVPDGEAIGDTVASAVDAATGG